MMKKQIHDIQSLIENRPVTDINSFSFISEKIMNTLVKNKRDMAYINDAQYSPLKIVLMGEVKSGKSTLLNTLVEEEVSNMGVTETTATIIEIKYGAKKEATIFFENGEQTHTQIDTVYKEFENNKEDTAYFQNIEKVVFTLPLRKLQEIELVDTPGVETISESNQKTTINYIQKSDVVLWVLNVHHLGQVSIDEKIMDVAQYGKPIILVVNRIDQIDSQEDITDVMDYIEEEYGFYTEASFPISAYNALNSLKSNDNIKYASSGMLDLMNYLEENIEKNSIEVKKDSVFSSTIQVLELEYSAFVMIREQMNLFSKILDERLVELEESKKELSEFIKESTNYWYNYEFLEHEKSEMIAACETNDSNIIQETIKGYFSSDYIYRTITSFFSDLSVQVNEKVHEKLELIGDKIINDAKISDEKIHNLLNVYELSVPGIGSLPEADIDFVQDGAKKGAAIGGTYGVVTALYSAILGPSAAYIGIGSALATALPPVLIAGVAGGAVWGLLTKDSNKKKNIAYVNSQFLLLKNKAFPLIEEPKEKLMSDVQKFMKNTHEEIMSSLISEMTIEQFKQSHLAVEKHTELLESKLHEVRSLYFEIEEKDDDLDSSQVDDFDSLLD